MTKTEALEKVEFWFADKVRGGFTGGVCIEACPGSDGTPDLTLSFSEEVGGPLED